jgi:(4-(4-[2-(gamma-L-glutamylamino)ethyl]phenoxymethyl)furan-2-yl)methanamine synthase
MPSADNHPVIGWDVGGAHLKACLVLGGEVADIAQWRCPLWQGLHHLDMAIAQARTRWPHPGSEGESPAFSQIRHAATMTGEIVDLFPSREAGVLQLATRLSDALGASLRLYGGPAGWIAPHDAGVHWRDIASANWHATAQWLGSAPKTGLRPAGSLKGSGKEAQPRLLEAGHRMLVDIGSTTTDLIPIADGRVAARGNTDARRLATGELLYLGVARTPVCVLGAQVSFGGETVNVMNEFFATSADIYRLTGELDPEHDQHPAADNGSKDLRATRQRLARMIGRDAADAPDDDWLQLACQWRNAQVALTRTQLTRVAAASDLPAGAELVAAGCGDFLVGELARSSGRPWRRFAEFVPIAKGPANRFAQGDTLPRWAQVCAPAVAVALLAAAGD